MAEIEKIFPPNVSDISTPTALIIEAKIAFDETMPITSKIGNTITSKIALIDDLKIEAFEFDLSPSPVM